jgi:bifunctional non-homologous end joining protein LigD
MSWAVPKGPSLDSADKRLAVHVEDHPIDYADFEGVIPAGEYGGGNVIVWDRGTWEAIGDPVAGMKKGDFKFELRGEKLVGRWVLVRLKPRPGEKRENWLLIKERDEHVRPRADYDLMAEEPLSVISGVDVEDVGLLGGAVSESETSGHGSALSDSPVNERQPVAAELVAPPALALCTLVKAVPSGSDWIGEVKYDGYRVTVALEAGTVRCYSRNGEDLTERLGPIANAIAKLPAQSALLDGEIVVFDDAGISRFGLLQDALGANPSLITFVAFDLLHLNGYDLTGLHTIERKDLLRTVVGDESATSPLRFAEYVEGDVSALLEVACAQGLEGVVAKRSDATYPVGRTHSWLKVKCRRAQEFVVGGFTRPKGSREGFGALLVGYHEDGALRYAGRVGSGFSDAQLTGLHSLLTQTVTATAPFSGEHPDIDSATWVTPSLVVQVAFAEWTSGGLLRQPSFIGVREDVDPTSVVREVIDDVSDVSATKTTASAPPRADLVLGIRISNPDKQLFPGGRLSKSELAEYYAAIAPLMLAEIAHRPLTLVRCPVGDGSGTCFYQRHPERGLPDAVKTISHALAGHDKPDEWLYVDDAAGLVALAQMGVAEIHTWLSRIDAPGRPDRIVFDLDPGLSTSWESIVAAATWVRAECEALGFTCFVKNTGSKGLHVVIPIEPVWEFERVRVLSRSIAEKIAADHPDELTTKMSKAARGGRIFIDYVRNSEGASAVAAYSTRHSEGPPIAPPLAWEEIDATHDLRREFTPELVRQRVKNGTDPWHALAASSSGVVVLKAAEKSLRL